jgi:hypothetical protein
MYSVEAAKNFELALDWDRKHPRPPAGPSDRPLEVNVLCTDVLTTANATEQAAELARGLNARLHVLVAQQVSYAVPLDNPPVSVQFEEQLVRKLAERCGVETRVEIFLCRDAEETLTRQLAPHSVVVVGAPRSWWPSREERLARRLRRLGHEVIVIDGKGNSRA